MIMLLHGVVEQIQDLHQIMNVIIFYQMIIQGHFIEGATNEFIRKQAACSLSREAVYAEFSICRSDLCERLCNDIQFVKDEIERAVDYLKNK